ncbi:MAG: putative glycoside hydrolase [bacterium]
MRNLVTPAGLRARLSLAATALVLAVGVCPSVCFGTHDHPRVGNLFTADVKAAYAPELAKWDLVVLNVSVQDGLPQLPGTLRSLNPEITILTYFPAAFIWAECDTGGPTVANFEAKIRDTDWWLYDTQGHRIGQEGNLWYINLTSKCSRDGSGKTLAEWLAEYVADEVYDSGLWDGFLLDGVGESIRWLNDADLFFRDPSAAVDSDRDGVADDPESLDVWWRAGVEILLQTLRREAGASAVIVPNGNNTFYQYANGGVREDFPHMHGGWQQNMFASYGYLRMCEDFLQEPMNATMILSYLRDVERDTFVKPASAAAEQFVRFTLASALLGDGYYFFGTNGLGTLWWYDYYDLDLGNPIGAAYLDSVEHTVDHSMRPVWRRDFENATVLCNPFNQYVLLDGAVWLCPEDGRIKMLSIPGPLEVGLCKNAGDRRFDQRQRTIMFSAAVTNPSAKAAQGCAWATLSSGGETVVTGITREILLGAGDTDTVSFGLRVPASLAVGTYCLKISVGGPGPVATDADTMYVAKVIGFDIDGKSVDDGNQTGYLNLEEGGLSICPQPALVSAAKALTLEVNELTSVGDFCSIRIFDAAGRLLDTVFEGKLEQGLVLDLGSGKGGAPRVPGVYFLHIQTRDKAATQKIVLLR